MEMPCLACQHTCGASFFFLSTISLFAQEAMVGAASMCGEGLCHTGQGVR